MKYRAAYERISSGLSTSTDTVNSMSRFVSSGGTSCRFIFTEVFYDSPRLHYMKQRDTWIYFDTDILELIGRLILIIITIVADFY